MNNKILIMLISTILLVCNSNVVYAADDPVLTSSFYDNYIIIKDYEFYQPYDDFNMGLRPKTGNYAVFANNSEKPDYSGYWYFSRYADNFNSLDSAINAYQSGQLSDTGYRLSWNGTFSYGNVPAENVYNDYVVRYANKDFFPSTPCRVPLTLVRAVGNSVQSQSPLQQIIAILPLTMAVVVSLVGLRKALRMLSTVLRGA